MPTVRSQRPRRPRRAAILIDYDNLDDVLAEHLDDAPSSSYVFDALDELRRYLLDADGTQTACLYAYGDFDELQEDDDSLSEALYLHGVEPQYAPQMLQPNTSELRLCVDAVDLLHREPDLHMLVIVTGDRTYLPLLQKLRHYGCQSLVVTMDGPDASAPESRAYGDVFMDLLNLLDAKARSEILEGGGRRTTFGGRQMPDPSTYELLDDPVIIRTIEVTQNHFGQYEEIYLTPLLRKLSDVLGEEHDPKALISELEDAGAIRLEKRDGYPYDYTVLILHRDHPTVADVIERVRPQDTYEAYDDSYNDVDGDGYAGEYSDDAPYDDYD